MDYKIENYKFIEENMEKKDSTRGIAIYVRESIVFAKQDKTKIMEERAPHEMLSIEIELREGKNLRLTSIYRSPNSGNINNANIDEFFKICGRAKRQHEIIVGDFNRKNIDWSTETSTAQNDMPFLEATRDSFLIQHVNKPTRARSSDQPALLDLFFTTNEDDIETLEVDTPIGKSDHAVVKVAYRVKPVSQADRYVMDFKKADFNKMRQRLSIDWEEYFKSCGDNIDEIWKKFVTLFREAENECIPRRAVKVGQKKYQYPFDRKTLRIRKKKYRLWKKYVTSNDSKTYQEYCRCRNQLRRMTRKCIKDHEKRIAGNAKKNSKVFWAYVNSKTKLKAHIPDLYAKENAKLEIKANSNEDKANMLGEFFASVFTKEPEWSWVLDETKYSDISERCCVHFNKDEVAVRLKKMNPNKSPGPDGLYPRVFKEIADVLVDPLHYIFRTSIKTGKLPTEWKTASITAIYKNKGSKNYVGNYRPISLTSIVCKMLESIIRDNILEYLKKNEILSDKQFGFLKGRSTVLQLLKVVDRWTEIIEEGGVVDVVYCDFQKAFDTVPHRRLLIVLKHYGIIDPVLSWIADFLRNRKQTVFVHGCPSQEFDVTSGVPQGSVLGPLLFICYINLMIEQAKEADMFLYADDLKLFKQINNEEDTLELQKNIDQLYDWTCYSLLKFHPGKCEAMRVKSQRKSGEQVGTYDIDGVKVRGVSKVDDLGVTCDENLTFEDHICKKVKKANALMGVIRRTFNHLDKEVFKQLFVSIVRPHLEYGAPIWNPHHKHLITLVENVQRRATKQIPGMRNLSYKERLKLLLLPTLEYRRYRGDMIEAFKMAHGLYDEKVTTGFLFAEQQSQPYYLRGHPYIIRKEKCLRDVRKYAFRCRITNQWNHLPDHVVCAPTLNSFKNRLDKLWELDDIKFDCEINLAEVTSSRKTRFFVNNIHE